jgi:RNA polymerase sigma factor (sigma-70 family)
MADYTHQDDQTLVERVTAREQDALNELYSRYGRRVYGMAYQVTQRQHLAEDITQDVFFQVWRWPERWNADKGRFLSWVLTVTRYTAIDYVRREQRQPTLHPHPDDLNMGHTDPLADNLAQTEQGATLRKGLKKLPKAQRTVILLAFFRGMTHDEIAKTLDIPVGTVKSRIRLGMKKLKDHLLEHHHQDLHSSEVVGYDHR